jgi:hypothetical protein
MPVKTVIIGKESSYMNQVTFNQCSGRAGRRGLEVFGNVIFFDVTLPRIYRYLNAQVPSIRGSMGISPSFILRLLISQHELIRHGKSVIVEAFNKLVVEQILSPLLSSMDDITAQNNEFSERMKYLFRYNLEFLYRTGLINSKGQPRPYSGIISHLHYTEPYNMLFTYFLQKGLFHSYLEQLNAPEENILVILCYLFGRYKTTWMSSNEYLLPKPPVQFIECADNFNTEVLNIYSDSVRATTIDLEIEALPYSQIDPWSSTISQPEDIHTSISSYARISGNKSREYHNFQHFVSTMRHTSITSTSLLPFASFYEEGLSAFILDYFQTQSRREVTKKFKFMNQMELDKCISEFSQRLSVLYFGLNNQKILDHSDPFMKCLGRIMNKFKDLAESEEADTESDTGTESDTHTESDTGSDSGVESEAEIYDNGANDIDSTQTTSSAKVKTQPFIVFDQANLLTCVSILFTTFIGLEIPTESFDEISMEREIFSRLQTQAELLSIQDVYKTLKDVAHQSPTKCAKLIVDRITTLLEVHKDFLSRNPYKLKKAAKFLAGFISSLDHDFVQVLAYAKARILELDRTNRISPRVSSYLFN